MDFAGKMFRGFATLAAVIFLMTPQGAQADAALTDGGMDLHLFRPAVDTRGHITVNGTDVLPHKSYSFGLVLDAGFGILPYRGFVTEAAATINRQSRIVRQAFTGNFQANVGLLDRLAIGIQIPVTFFRGSAVQVPTTPGGCDDPATGCFYNVGNVPDGLSFQGFGDLRLHIKARLYTMSNQKVGIGTVLRMQFPTSDDSKFAGEPGVGLWPTVVFDFRPHKRVFLSLEGGYRYNSGKGATFVYNGRSEPAVPTVALNAQPVAGEGTTFQYDDLITFGLGASFRIAPKLDFVTEFYGTQIAQAIGTNGTTSMEALGGLKVFVQDHSYLMIAAGAGIPKVGFQAADIRGTLGFVFEPSVGDRDGDGIRDDVDGCPDDPEDKDGFEDEDGCPDPDNDQDGIPDLEDACPDIPEDFDGEDDEDGCPEGRRGDRDGDGIMDDIDACPDVPEDFDGFQDDDGCPENDNDKDGIPDKQDLCPNDREDKDGFEDKDGCPDLDNDGDRIVDTDDACPNDPETYNGYEDQDGCPDRGKVIVEDTQIVILDKIYFATDSAEILPRSFPIIEAVAATLIGNPQITLIEIQGHADERGGDGYNIRLTKARAASVEEAMVTRGVAPERVRSAGYGERCPVDPGHGPEAWDKNRRVEFKIIETEDGPTGVEVTCPAGRRLMPR